MPMQPIDYDAVQRIADRLFDILEEEIADAGGEVELDHHCAVMAHVYALATSSAIASAHELGAAAARQRADTAVKDAYVLTRGYLEKSLEARATGGAGRAVQ